MPQSLKQLAVRSRPLSREIAASAFAIAIGLGIGALDAQESPPQNEQQNKPANATRVPEIVVTAPKFKPKPKAAARPQSAPNLAAVPNTAAATQAALDTTMQGLDQARDNNLLPKIGASTYTCLLYTSRCV